MSDEFWETTAFTGFGFPQEVYKQVIESIPTAEEAIALLKAENKELRAKIFELQTRLNEYHSFVDLERRERRRIAKMRRKLLGESG